MNTSNHQPDPRDQLPEELRRLRVGGPEASLRQDTLRAVRLALDESTPRKRDWWAPWRVELGFMAAIAFTCSLLSFCLLSPTCRLPETLRPLPDSSMAAAPATAAPIDAELEELGPFTQRYRDASPRRVSERRYDHADIDHL